MNEAFPQAVIAGNMIFISGMAGIDVSTGRLVGTSFEEQAMQAFENIRILLEEAGSSMSKVIKTTIFMVAGNDFAIVNKVYKHYFPTEAPARSVPQVLPFPGDILISVECIAVL